LSKLFKYFLILLTGLAFSCSNDPDSDSWVISDYSGTFINTEYTENLAGEFAPGIYEDNAIPQDIKQLQYGRIEIDFQYDGGGLFYFMPLFYYGSMNYNVIPFPVEYLFYTISTFRQPQYCRDTFSPVITGGNYTFIVDKKPEGMILQLKKGTNILNIFPHSFFPDSSQLFFKEITSYISQNQGDSLEKVLMVGKGFAGIEKGIHDLNGQVTSLRIFKYNITNRDTGYELKRIRNQHTENQKVTFAARDNLSGNDKLLLLKYQFYPYKFEGGEMVPHGEMQTGESAMMQNDETVVSYLRTSDIGYYKVSISTLSKEGNIIRSTVNPFEIWVYPEEWGFEFYR
jgi:hypothetical protein